MKQSITLPRKLVNTLSLNLYYIVKLKEKKIVERISLIDFNINVISTKMSVVFTIREFYESSTMAPSFSFVIFSLC